MRRKQKSISAVKTESCHSHCKGLYCTADSLKAPQIALMHSRQLDCTAEGSTEENFTAWQKALMHSKQLQCTAESFTVQQEALSHSRKFCYIAKKSVLRQKLEKSSFCGRNWRKVSPAAEIEEKFILQQKLEKRQSCGRNWKKFSPRQKLEKSSFCGRNRGQAPHSACRKHAPGKRDIVCAQAGPN